MTFLRISDTGVAAVAGEQDVWPVSHHDEKISVEDITIGARQVNSSYHRRVPVVTEAGARKTNQDSLC